MNKKLTYTELEEQSIRCVEYYFYTAVKSIDEKFTKGYAEKHPELIGAYINCIAREVDSSSKVKGLYELTEAITESLNGLTDAITESLNGLTDAIDKNQ